MFHYKTVVILFLAITVTAKKSHKRKHETKHVLQDEEHIARRSHLKDVFMISEEDEVKNERKEKYSSVENELDSTSFNHDKDSCAKHKCSPGKICHLDEAGEAQCVCIRKCPEEKDERRKVCSNHNETWNSDCELYRMRCLCTEDREGCKFDRYRHVHVDYFGACRDIGKCSKAEMEDFPRRMREWLFNVMQDLARRSELHGPVLKLEQEAERSHSRRWVNAVIWKFCDLDVHPQDRKVSRHELFPIRAPLMVMEHCIAPFLDGCDTDDDHMITLKEWGDCLGLNDDEIQDKCVHFFKRKNG